MRFLNLLDTSSYTFFSLLCFSIVACSSSKNSHNENEADSKILKVNPTTINISASATKITLNISADDYDYVKSRSCSWVTAATTSAVKTATFELTVAENKGYLHSLTQSKNVMESGSDAFALFNRSSNPAMNIYDPGTVNAIMDGAQTSSPN